MIPKAVSEMLEKLAHDDGYDPEVVHAIAGMVCYANEMRTALSRMQPGDFPATDVKVKSLAISLRQQDGRIFIVCRAEKNPGRKNPDKIVCFGSGRELDGAWYEMFQRINIGSAKWREDVPYEPEDPHDRPEALPKWGD